MTQTWDERRIDFVKTSMKRGLPLHQLEEFLDRLDNVQLATMAVKTDARPLPLTRSLACPTPPALE